MFCTFISTSTHNKLQQIKSLKQAKMATGNGNIINEENLIYNNQIVTHARLSNLPNTDRIRQVVNDNSGLTDEARCLQIIDRTCDAFTHLPHVHQYYNYQNDNGLYNSYIRPGVQRK